MSVDAKEGEQDKESKTDVKENDSSSSESLIKSNEVDTEATANIAEDQELKMLPENDGEQQEKVVEVKEGSAIKSLPRATTTNTSAFGKTKRKGKKKNQQLQLQKQNKQQQKKEVPIPNVYKKLEQQSTVLSIADDQKTFLHLRPCLIFPGLLHICKYQNYDNQVQSPKPYHKFLQLLHLFLRRKEDWLYRARHIDSLHTLTYTPKPYLCSIKLSPVSLFPNLYHVGLIIYMQGYNKGKAIHLLHYFHNLNC